MTIDAVSAVRRFSRFYTNHIGALRAGLLDTPMSLTEARVVYELAHAEADLAEVPRAGMDLAEVPQSGADLAEGGLAELAQVKVDLAKVVQAEVGLAEPARTVATQPGLGPAGRVQPGSAETADLRRRLDIDAGYLSRILRRLESDGLAERERSTTDARRQRVRLTERGRAFYAELDARSTAQIRALLDGVAESDRRRLVAAMTTVEEIFTGRPRPTSFVLRPPAPGDLGWVVQRHGALYADEYGWDHTFEAYVARIVADYATSADPRREAGWIAEIDGVPVGSIFCVRKDDTTAQLRLLLVEPGGRGAGVGARLVEECLRFASRAGYTQIVLFTVDVLAGARRIYERAGFGLVSEQRKESFGHSLVHQYWSRAL